jgi:hypothetical protein
VLGKCLAALEIATTISGTSYWNVFFSVRGLAKVLWMHLNYVTISSFILQITRIAYQADMRSELNSIKVTRPE